MRRENPFDPSEIIIGEGSEVFVSLGCEKEMVTRLLTESEFKEYRALKGLGKMIRDLEKKCKIFN